MQLTTHCRTGITACMWNPENLSGSCMGVITLGGEGEGEGEGVERGRERGKARGGRGGRGRGRREGRGKGGGGRGEREEKRGKDRGRGMWLATYKHIRVDITRFYYVYIID